MCPSIQNKNQTNTCHQEKGTRIYHYPTTALVPPTSQLQLKLKSRLKYTEIESDPEWEDK